MEVQISHINFKNYNSIEAHDSYGRLLGRAGLTINSDHSYLAGLMVEKNYVNLGIGKSLVEYAVKLSKLPKVMLDVSSFGHKRKTNAQLMAYYGKLGFTHESIKYGIHRLSMVRS